METVKINSNFITSIHSRRPDFKKKKNKKKPFEILFWKIFDGFLS